MPRPGPAEILRPLAEAGGVSDPFVVLGDARTIWVAYSTPAPTVMRVDATTGAPIETASFPASFGRIVAADGSPSRLVFATTGGVFSVVPSRLSPPDTFFSPTGVDIIRDLAMRGDEVVVGVTAGGRAQVRTYGLEGDVGAERNIDAAPPADDPLVAVRGDHILVSARLPGEALILDGDLREVFDPGPLFNNPRIAPTRTGFFAVSTDTTVSDAVLTFLDECP